MSGARVKLLEWEDFEGMGAKASAFYNANYLITLWRGRGEFEVSMSYPGYQTGYDGPRFHATLKAAKAAAQADYEARILSALDLTALAEAMRCPEVRAIVDALEWYASMMESPKSADLMALDADNGMKARAAIAAMQEPPE